MATNKPELPSITFPDNFGTSASNVKTPYTNQELINGYSHTIQQVYDGGNLNYFLGGVFQNNKYIRVFTDWLRNIGTNKVPYINSSNQLDSVTPVISSANNTFSGVNTFTNSKISRFGIDLTQNPTTTVYQVVNHGRDINDTTIGVEYFSWGNNVLSHQIDVRKNVGGVDKNAYIRATIRENGETVCECSEPTTTSSQSLNQVATTGWANNPSKSTNIVHRTGDEAIYGSKNFYDNFSRLNAFSGDATAIKIVDTSDKGNISMSAYYASNGIFARFSNRNNTSQKTEYLDIITKDDGNVIVTGTTNVRSGIANFSLPNYNTAWVSIPVSSGTEYTFTAPYNCFLYLKTQGTGVQCVIRNNGGAEIMRNDVAAQSASIQSCWCILAKNDKVRLFATGNTITSHYIPLLGN